MHVRINTGCYDVTMKAKQKRGKEKKADKEIPILYGLKKAYEKTTGAMTKIFFTQCFGRSNSKITNKLRII